MPAGQLASNPTRVLQYCWNFTNIAFFSWASSSTGNSQFPSGVHCLIALVPYTASLISLQARVPSSLSRLICGFLTIIFSIAFSPSIWIAGDGRELLTLPSGSISCTVQSHPLGWLLADAGWLRSPGCCLQNYPDYCWLKSAGCSWLKSPDSCCLVNDPALKLV